jgi:hypothetical protein
LSKEGGEAAEAMQNLMEVQNNLAYKPSTGSDSRKGFHVRGMPLS